MTIIIAPITARRETLPIADKYLRFNSLEDIAK
jgi:hypothetical protein